jgi:hypothetical protein
MLPFSLSVIVALLPSYGNRGSYGQPSAALWEDQLFVAINGRPFLSPGRLYRGTFTPAERRVRSPVEYYNDPFLGHPATQAKLDVRDNRVLLNSGSKSGYYILPMNILPELEANKFGDLLSGSPSRKASLLPYSGRVDHLLFPPHRKPDVPLSDAPLSDSDWVDGHTPSVQRYLRHLRDAHFDVQIDEEKSVWLYYAYKDKLFVSVEPDCLSNWYLDGKGNVAKDLPEPPERQLRTGKLPADFRERFAAYTAGRRGYLVTPSGKIYMVAAKGEKEVEVSAVWDDPKRKIVGVVQDHLTNGAVYGWGFVTDSAAPERFYVMFDPKPVAVAYKRTVPLWDDRSDAYLESYECARAFRKANAKK